jgi:hypothetical protein
VLQAEAEALLPFGLNGRRDLRSTICTKLAVGRIVKPIFGSKIVDQVERFAVALADRSQVSVGRRDTHPAREPAQVSARYSVLVVLGHIHRMESDCIDPMPCQNLAERLIEDRSQL